MAWVSLGM